MTTKMKLMALGLGMVLSTGCSSVDELIEDYVGDDEDQYTSSMIYLKDSSSTGVAGIEYNCDGGFTSDGELTTSGTTTSTGNMPIDYWPGYDLKCTIAFVDASDLYLYDANGPINDVQLHCNSFIDEYYYFTGENGYDGSINNASSDTCYIDFMLN